jgi:hypothetical protein
MATPTSKFALAFAGLCLIAAPALADHKDGKKHYNNEPYYDAMSRSDFIALNAGDAPQANITIQADDVWPSYVNDTHIHTEGVVGELVIKKFKARNAPAAAPPAPSITINAGPPAPGAP